MGCHPWILEAELREFRHRSACFTTDAVVSQYACQSCSAACHRRIVSKAPSIVVACQFPFCCLGCSRLRCGTIAAVVIVADIVPW